ncbi:hypothetical protein LIER_33451 [Lithospermum erythrorhizon]|uniref:Uncharacterized protein n=1 Tax=Lithospermum erythrorhizon TaxID=34254 RepID=A0AAV3RWS6_LITER
MNVLDFDYNMSQNSVNTTHASRRLQRSRAFSISHATSSATPTAEINIRAPPPMVGSFMKNRTFRHWNSP